LKPTFSTLAVLGAAGEDVGVAAVGVGVVTGVAVAGVVTAEGVVEVVFVATLPSLRPCSAQEVRPRSKTVVSDNPRAFSMVVFSFVRGLCLAGKIYRLCT